MLVYTLLLVKKILPIVITVTEKNKIHLILSFGFFPEDGEEKN